MEYILIVLNTIFIQVILPIIGTTLSFLVFLILKKFLTEMGIKVDGIKYSNVIQKAQDAAKYAEQEANKYYKLTGNKMPSEEKLELAINYLSKEVSENITEEMIIGYIESVLIDLDFSDPSKK